MSSKIESKVVSQKLQWGDDARYYNNYNGGMMLVI